MILRSLCITKVLLFVCSIVVATKDSRDNCLQHGIESAPSRADIYSTEIHHRACHQRCIATSSDNCMKYRFWEDGSCTLLDASNGVLKTKLPKTLQYGDSSTQQDLKHKSSKRRRRLQQMEQAKRGSGGNIKRGYADERSTGLTPEAFYNLPNVVRGTVQYKMVRRAYEVMVEIWNERPFKPINSEELEKWGAVMPGRSEGRVLECLKKLALINVRRNGLIMIRKYPGKPPEGIRVATGSAAGGPHLGMNFLKQFQSYRDQISDKAYIDEDEWNQQYQLKKNDDLLRFVSGSLSCSEASNRQYNDINARQVHGLLSRNHIDVTNIRQARFVHNFAPVVHVADFMPALTNTNYGGKSRGSVSVKHDSPLWDEKRPQLKQGCQYIKRVTHDEPLKDESNLIEKSPRLCQIRCAAKPSCLYFSYTASGICNLHEDENMVMEETTEPLAWCGPSPNCPYRHKLNGLQVTGRNSSGSHLTLCSYSSSEEKIYPWPWFNEFSLEALLLRRWRASLLSCRIHHRLDFRISSEQCAQDADIIVIPSLYLHGTGFTPVNPWDDAEAFLPVLDREKKHRSFWEKIKMRYARVHRNKVKANSSSEELESDEYSTSTTWPLIVVHSSYVFDATWNLGMLHSLLHQPIDFQERVIIATIESHLHIDEAKAFPFGWTANGLAHPRYHRGPRIVTLPYPLSIASINHQASQNSLNDGVSGSGGDDNGNIRPIAVLFAGSLDRGQRSNTGRNGKRNVLRPFVVTLMRRHGAVCTQDCCGICMPGHELECEAYLLHHEQERLWELPAHSAFCLEPPGDTLTRSHFFVAMMTGCIPIIFDGGDGSSLYDSHSPTYWPWRLFESSTTEPGWAHNRKGDYHIQKSRFNYVRQNIGLNYSKFTVTVNTTEVLESAYDFLNRIIDIVMNDRKSFRSLQTELLKAASRMIYASESTRSSPVKNDAFDQFLKLVTAPGVLTRRHHYSHHSHSLKTRAGFENAHRVVQQ